MRGGRVAVGTAVLVVAYGTLAAADPGAGPGAGGGSGPSRPGDLSGPGGSNNFAGPSGQADPACAPDSVAKFAALPASGPADIARVKAAIAAKRLGATCLQTALTAACSRLQTVQRDSDLAVERYDIAAARVARADADAAAERAAYAVARAGQDAAQERLGRFAAEAYRRGPDLVWATAFLQARTPHDFALARYAFRSTVESRAHAVAQARAATAAADGARAAATAAAEVQHDAEQEAADARDRAQRAVAGARSELAALQARQDALLAGLAAAQGVEIDLERQRQRELAHGPGGDAGAPGNAGVTGANATGSGTAAAPVPAQPRARALLAYVRAQLGKPYVWGAAGPDTFDCSGLAMRGLQAAGLTYPHPAQWQYLAMRPVAYSRLQPGDLVFWATDPADPHTIYHEAVYVGADRVIQAPRPGGVVDAASLWDNGVPSFYARP